MVAQPAQHLAQANPPHGIVRSTSFTPRPPLHFSVTGFTYCLMMMFMGLAALNTQANLLFGVFGLMIGILIISGIISRLVLRGMHVQRNLPEHGIVGEPMTILYEITNRKKYWPSLSLGVAELDGAQTFNRQPQCYMLHAAPGMTATVPVELFPRQRGLHSLESVQLSTSFPFGFIKRAIIQKHKNVICVYPAIAEVDRKIIAMCQSAETFGTSQRPQPGGMDEFYGVREYQNGDNPRQIYWRRSARTGVLVAKDMSRVSPPRFMLVVDTYLVDVSPESTALVERVIAMAASLASAALGQEMSVGLCVWSGKKILLSPTRGKQQRKEVLTLLAQLEFNTVFTGKCLLEETDTLIKSGTSIVILTSRDANNVGADLPKSLISISASDPAMWGLFRFRKEVSFDVIPLRQPGVDRKVHERTRKPKRIPHRAR